MRGRYPPPRTFLESHSVPWSPGASHRILSSAWNKPAVWGDDAPDRTGAIWDQAWSKVRWGIEFFSYLASVGPAFSCLPVMLGSLLGPWLVLASDHFSTW